MLQYERLSVNELDPPRLVSGSVRGPELKENGWTGSTNCDTEARHVKMGSMGMTDQELLEHALDEAKAVYIKNHAVSQEMYDESTQRMPGGNTRSVLYASPFPFTVETARSCYLTTVDGKEYIDFLGEYTAGIYGHSHPAIREAVERALDQGWNYGAHSEAERELAKLICNRFPVMEKVRFTNSGTEANTLAIASALAIAAEKGPNKRKVLAFQKSYHGATLSMATDARSSINVPYDFITGMYNDVAGTKQLVSSLPPHSLAAIIVEPMIGSGGCFAASKEFMVALREIADQQEALLIFDEVMTSRLAYNGFATVYGIQCDIMTIGKYLGGGMSFGAFGGREDIMSLYDPRTKRLNHPGTFNNNVFSMNAGIAGSKILTRERLNELNDLGNDMRLRVEAVFNGQQLLQEGTVPSTPIIDESMHTSGHLERPPKIFVKGVGSMMCIHFAGTERELLQGLFWLHMLEQGIYIAQRGFIALSIEIQTEHVERFVYAVDSFCRQYDPMLRWS